MNLQIVRPNEAAKLLGVSRCTLYRWVREGHLPPPVKLGHGDGHGGISGWKEEDLATFIDRLKAIPQKTTREKKK